MRLMRYIDSFRRFWRAWIALYFVPDFIVSKLPEEKRADIVKWALEPMRRPLPKGFEMKTP